MSVRALSRVWEFAPVAGSELLALLALADWADDDGFCYPGMAAVARKIRLQERQAQRVVHRLIDAGLVHVVGNGFGGAPGSTRRYRIDLEKLKAIESSGTGVMHDTPCRQTGVFHDGDGCLPRRVTGVLEDTLTVKDTSKNRQREATRSPSGSRLSAEWAPSDIEVQFCKTERPDLDPKKTADRFRDYWTAQPGAKGVKLDWAATWRNWVRNESAPAKPTQPQRNQFAGVI